MMAEVHASNTDPLRVALQTIANLPGALSGANGPVAMTAVEELAIIRQIAVEALSAPTPFTERMNELIAWARERQATYLYRANNMNDAEAQSYYDGRVSAFREVANHLRQLSQGAKTDEG